MNMKTAKRFLSLVSALALVAAFALPSTALAEKTRLGFGGGPEGGTFQYFSNGIALPTFQNAPGRGSLQHGFSRLG